MRHRCVWIFATLAFAPWLLTVGCNGGGESSNNASTNSTDSTFKSTILPIFGKCMPCHSAQNATASLVLESYDSLMKGGVSGSPVSAGDADGSLIVKRVTAADGFTLMPLQGTPLTNEEIEELKEWIDAGALEE
ncbi:MAG: hypothetical protein IH944_10650 [Armatimonadetes bacterium]|nr:hypothetical protein [Armatimonadota bacterium]